MLKSPQEPTTEAPIDTVPTIYPGVANVIVEPVNGDQFAVIALMALGGEYPVIYTDTQKEANDFVNFIGQAPLTYTVH